MQWPLFQYFYDPAPIDMKQQTMYILSFLHATAGFDVSINNTNAPPSQLALETKFLWWDPILYQWALNQFGGIIQIACYAGHNTTQNQPIMTAHLMAPSP